MFEKLTKRFSSKATENAIEGVKTTFNDRMEQYGDIIKIGLVLSVIIFGGRHLTKKSTPTLPDYSGLYSYRLPPGNGQPIIINNYYRDEYREANQYHGQESFNRKTEARKTPQKR